MLDIRFVRENPEIVKENIKKKFQDAKLPLVDEVIALDAKRRAAIAEADQLRADRSRLSKQVGMLMGQAKKDPSKLEEAEAVKAQVKEQADRLAELERQEAELEERVHHLMLVIPNIIDPSVPIGPDFGMARDQLLLNAQVLQTVRHRAQVWHGAHRRVSSGGRCRCPGGDCLLIRKTRLPKMHMHIDETWNNQTVG